MIYLVIILIAAVLILLNLPESGRQIQKRRQSFHDKMGSEPDDDDTTQKCGAVQRALMFSRNRRN